MTVTIKILQCEYKDGMVYTAMCKPAFAVQTATVRNVAELADAVEALRLAWTGHVDGQIYLPGTVEGRKFAGYDNYRHGLVRDIRR